MSLDTELPLGEPPLDRGKDLKELSRPLCPSPEESDPVASLQQSLQRYRPTLIAYYTLALEPSLSAAEEAQMEAILAQSVEDPLLSFWLDEVDCWAADHLHLMSEEALRRQQQQLQRLVGQSWIDSLWKDLQNRPRAIQTYLQRLGVYGGAIDGIVGPQTQRAIESLKTAYAEDRPLGCL